MDTSQNAQGVPAEWRPTDLDDGPTNNNKNNNNNNNNNSNNNNIADIITKTFSGPVHHSILHAGTILPGAGPSPLPSPELKARYLPYQHPQPTQWESFQLDGMHPPTPPRQDEDDEFGLLRQWNAQEGHRVYTGSTHSRYSATTDSENSHQGLQSTPSLRTSIAAGAPPRLHPSANILQSSPPQAHSYRPTAPHPATPSIQQWPTNNLMVDEATRKKQEAYRRKAQARRQSRTSQSSGTHSVSSTATPRKRKAGITSTLVSPTPPPPLRHAHPDPLSNGYEADSTMTDLTDSNRGSDQYYASHQNSFHQYSPVSFTHPSSLYALQYTPGYASLYAPQYAQHASSQYAAPLSVQQGYQNTMNTSGFTQQDIEMHTQQHHRQRNFQPPSTAVTREYAHTIRERPPRPTPPPPRRSPARPLTREELPQSITNVYDQYKWPVKLYQLRPDSDFPYAFLFLNAYLEEHIYKSTKYKWHAHITEGGGIKDGDSHSILVLHNAANPFTWDPPAESTTTVGVYDSRWQLHWTTFTPGIADLLQTCIDQGFFALKQTWHVDMKPTDKRFHRAYWLAANMAALGNLLNGIEGEIHGREQDGGEEEDDGFELSEEDLQRGWEEGDGLSEEMARRVWGDSLREVEGVDDDALGREHIEVGGTERVYAVSP